MRISVKQRAILLAAVVMAFVLLPVAALGADEAGTPPVVTDHVPITTGMQIKFNLIVTRMITDTKWQLTVTGVRYPDMVRFEWVKDPVTSDSGPSSGRREVYGLATSRNFRPVFLDDENKTTTDTAPWVSVAVLEELRTRKTASNFRVGGASLMGVLVSDLKVDETTAFEVILDGKKVLLPAFKVSGGQLIIWDNPNCPLVLQYNPAGIPVLTSLVGWKVTEIRTK